MGPGVRGSLALLGSFVQLRGRIVSARKPQIFWVEATDRSASVWRSSENLPHEHRVHMHSRGSLGLTIYFGPVLNSIDTDNFSA